MIQQVLESQQSTSRSLSYCKYLILQEILKMFMKQISSLKELEYNSAENLTNVAFTYFPGTTNYLTDLRVLRCSSDVYPEFFYQLSQICCNIQSITIGFEDFVSNGLNDLISSQSGLKYLSLIQSYDGTDWEEIIPSFVKHSDSLIKLKIYGDGNCGPLSFIYKFTNLQELVISFEALRYFDDFELQHASFPQLKVLKFPLASPTVEVLTKFLENHGKNLTEFHYGFNSLFNLTIAKLCPNLKSLYTILGNNDAETLKVIFNSCQHLESFKFWYYADDSLLDEEFLKILAKYSPKNFHEIKLHVGPQLEILPEVLESFFIDWKSRTSQKSLSVIIIKDNHYWVLSDENMKIIEKYKKLGVIKKFKIKDYKAEEYENYILL